MGSESETGGGNVAKGALPEPPPKWGEDPLSEFFDKARHNQFATFDSLPPEYARLVEIDRAFRSLVDRMENCTTVILVFMLLRAHAAYLAAAQLATAGQTVEAYPVLRSCLEAALYALFMAERPERQKIWAERDESEAQLRLAKNAFTAGAVLDAVRQKVPHVHKTASDLYKHTIEQGAHPNPASIFSNLKIEVSETHYHYELIYLAKDGPVLRSCLKTTAEVGVCVLAIFGAIFPERFQAAGLQELMPTLAGVR